MNCIVCEFMMTEFSTMLGGIRITGNRCDRNKQHAFFFWEDGFYTIDDGTFCIVADKDNNRFSLTHLQNETIFLDYMPLQDGYSLLKRYYKIRSFI